MIVATCGCGREYTLPQWEALEYVGEMGDEVEKLELRNCHCRSTIARPIENEEEPG